MEDFHLIKGDCLIELKNIPDKSVDIVITDLPYGQTDCDWDIRINLEELWKELKRVARNNKTPFFFFTTTKFGFELIKSNEKWFRYDFVVEKQRCVGHLNSGKMPMRKHEMVYVFYKNLPCYNKEKYHKVLSSIPHKRVTSKLYGNQRDDYDELKYDIPCPSSILKMDNNTFANRKNRNHPTEKTTDILEWILKYYSNEGDTCLDPTMGSGSTGVACKNLGRKFIGIELDQGYYDIAVKRIKEDIV